MYGYRACVQKADIRDLPAQRAICSQAKTQEAVIERGAVQKDLPDASKPFVSNMYAIFYVATNTYV